MKRVLLVDDDPILLELMSIWLRSEGFEVEQALDGQSAQSCVSATEYELIVLDLLMPVMDGIRFLRWLREEEKRDTPVLIVSSMANENQQHILDVEGVDIARKPVNLEVFMEKARKLMGM